MQTRMGGCSGEERKWWNCSLLPHLLVQHLLVQHLLVLTQEAEGSDFVPFTLQPPIHVHILHKDPSPPGINFPGVGNGCWRGREAVRSVAVMLCADGHIDPTYGICTHLDLGCRFCCEVWHYLVC